jgi:hypothetical protein
LLAANLEGYVVAAAPSEFGKKLGIAETTALVNTRKTVGNGPRRAVADRHDRKRELVGPRSEGLVQDRPEEGYKPFPLLGWGNIGCCTHCVYYLRLALKNTHGNGIFSPFTRRYTILKKPQIFAKTVAGFLPRFSVEGGT